MNPERKIRIIEFTVKRIFEKDKINDRNIILANKLFDKWKKLTKYKEDYEYPILDDILDKEPICKN
jgi:hypothetical protein